MGTDAEKTIALWDGFLEKIEREYRDNPDTYLRCEAISRCTHPGGAGLAAGYWHKLQEQAQFLGSISLIHDGDVGHPHSVEKFEGLSPATVHHAHNFYVIEQSLGVSIANNDVAQVVEIGGGYGNMARIARNLGYIGRWIIVDFPIMLEMQKKYLSDNGIKDVEFVGADSELCFDQRDTSILLACYSVCEMPMHDRQKYEKCYARFDYLFFTHNNFFGGISNIEYFYNLKGLLERQKFKVDWFPDLTRQGQSTSHWFLSAK